MSKIRQHIPGFCSGLEPQSAEFETLKDLIEIPWVKRWKDSLDKGDTFTGYARGSETKEEHLLMAMYNNNTRWFVIGYMTKDSVSELVPEWKPDFSVYEKQDRERND